MEFIKAFCLAFITVAFADVLVGLVALPEIVDAVVVGGSAAGGYWLAERLGWVTLRRRQQPFLEPQTPIRHD